jgi:hypothetical protein
LHAAFPKISNQRIAECLEGRCVLLRELSPVNSLCFPLDDPTLQLSFRVKWIVLGSENQINLLLIKCIDILFLNFEAVRFFLKFQEFIIWRKFLEQDRVFD